MIADSKEQNRILERFFRVRVGEILLPCPVDEHAMILKLKWSEDLEISVFNDGGGSNYHHTKMQLIFKGNAIEKEPSFEPSDLKLDVRHQSP